MHSHPVPVPVSVSIVIPAWNEAGNIEQVLQDCAEALEPIPGTHEVIVVDDASTDATPQLLVALQARYSFLRVLTNEVNVGCHPSVRRGLDAATGDWLLFLPADRQIRADTLPTFLTRVREADMVCSYRRRRADPAYRVWLSRFYNWVIRRVIGVGFRDFDSSVLIRRAAYAAVAGQLVANSASLSVELLVRIMTSGYRVAEVEIDHYPRLVGKATGLNLRDSLRVPINLIRVARVIQLARAQAPQVVRAA